MANLYLTEQGSVLTKRGDRLRVLKEKKLLLDVPCHEIDGVLVFGNVQLTTQAIAELFDQGIELALFSSRGRLRGQLTSPMTKNVDLRLKQYARHMDADFALRLARIVVAAKIVNQTLLLERFADDHSEAGLASAIAALRDGAAAAESAAAFPELLGVEGAAAAAYFGAFGVMIRGAFDFPGRRKRPPPDPVNALLSFGYTLLFNEISSFLDGMGFDPYIGYLHKPEYGRPSLAADLIEEFRAPVVDRFTLRLVNLQMFQPADFTLHTPSGGMHLTATALKRYFAAYEEFLQEPFRDAETGQELVFRRAYRRQAERLARCIVYGDGYTPFRWFR